LRLRTREGYALRLTPDHRVRRVSKKTRWRLESEWVAAETLRSGDEIVIHDHRARTDWPGPYGRDEGYLIGLLIGDGTHERVVVNVAKFDERVQRKLK